ncbi:hypothetical protein [Runella sp.]|uniref:hypothetical protein n=1 Tax=Runella sp. TaxID=1960881 RepID=UPI003D149517
METSASMKGYLKGKTEFKDVVTNLIAVLGKDTIPDSVWTISDNPVKYRNSPQSFANDLATTPLATARSSKLHKIFDAVGDKAGSNNVSILVSDCILSFSDAEIRADREINRNNASSTLKSSIKSTFGKLRAKYIGATLYAFQSSFNGPYFDYRNNNQPVSGENRPFYVWVIGHRDVIGHVNKLLQEDDGFKPEKFINFGDSNSEIKSFDLLFSYGKEGDWQARKNEVREIKLTKTKPVTFSIGVNLNLLPAYVLQDLNRNLQVSSQQATIKLIKIEKAVEVMNLSKKDREKKLINNNTHIFTFRISDMRGNDDATADIILPYRFDDWYMTWSTDDDLLKENRLHKTFAFKHLVTGAKEAYDTGNSNYLNIQLKFSKN